MDDKKKVNTIKDVSKVKRVKKIKEADAVDKVKKVKGVARVSRVKEIGLIKDLEGITPVQREMIMDLVDKEAEKLFGKKTVLTKKQQEAVIKAVKMALDVSMTLEEDQEKQEPSSKKPKK